MVVLTEKKGNVGWIYLNQPKSLNSITTELAAGALAAIEEMEQDAEVRVIVFSGAGRAFCAGGNLQSLDALDTAEAAEDFVSTVGAVSQALYDCSKPVIGMINGVAAGAGFNLALACDILFAAEGVKFIQSFSNIGLAPDFGGHYFLPRAIGPWLAKKAMFDAAPITAEEGLRLGFVNAVYPAETLLAETEKYAEWLAGRAPLALAACKKLINHSGEMTLAEVMEVESINQAQLLMSEDCKEGLQAFAEKRQPVFRGK